MRQKVKNLENNEKGREKKKTDPYYTLFRRLSTLSLCRALVSPFDVDAVPKPLRIRPAALVDWARHLPRWLYGRRGSWSRSVVGGLCSVFVIKVWIRRPWSRSRFEACSVFVIKVRVRCSWFKVRDRGPYSTSVIKVRVWGLCSIFVIQSPWSKSLFYVRDQAPCSMFLIQSPWSRSTFDARVRAHHALTVPHLTRYPDGTSSCMAAGGVRPGPDQLGSQALRLAMPPMPVPCRSPWGAMMAERSVIIIMVMILIIRK